ncbi:MAG: FtsK/SpoIIIE domain-containing protein [Actinomycetota bacterium]|nr:FtsK/SpoIIIE domain-containing protein [Actinomycetota bacterium]
MASREGVVETLLSATLGLAWSFRIELTAIAAVASASAAAVRYLGPVAGSLAVAVPLAAVAAWPTGRRWTWRKLRHASLRRRYLAAVRVAGFDRLKLDRAPSVIKVRDTPAGYSLQVRLPAGTSSTDLDNTAEVTAAAMGVADIRVARDPHRASLATVSVVQRDALSGPPLAWPLTGSPWWSLWEPIPVGLDENGDTVAVSLPEHNVLLGGEPGAGKSAALSLLVAASALDPTVTLWLLDGKRVELAVWEPCATRLVGPDLAEAIDVLDHLRTEMDARYAQLLAWKRRKVSPEDGLGLHVVIVDELALYLATGDRKTRDRLAESLRDLIARGRAAGVIVLAATQRPSSDIVPTSVRDLFGFRWAMRCATRDSSDTILGAGWAAEGYSASDIDPANRGVGYLLHEGGTPLRMRSAYLDDPTLNAIADRAASIRHSHET